MVKIPTKVIARFKTGLPKYRRILKSAHDRDVLESDTVVIVTNMLSDVFGFDQFAEVTSEYAIKGNKGDLVVKMKDKVKYLIEVKAIGMGLTSHHRDQATDYCSRLGVPWFVLTNGMTWEICCVTFKKPVGHQVLCTFEFADLDIRALQDQTHLFLLCKEGIAKGAIKEYNEHLQVANRYVVAALIQSDPVLKVLRRGLKRLSPGLKISTEDISLLLDDVLKRDVIEGEPAEQAARRLRRRQRMAGQGSMERKVSKKNVKPNADVVRTVSQPASLEDKSTTLAAPRRKSRPE